MYETGHNNMTFTTVVLKTAWEYLEAYLRYSDFAQNNLKQFILSILSTLQLSEFWKKIFSANQYENV